ncbi:HAMP domain-containing histidine kinase [Actinomadura barringtoniae]|uniref:histidine kinase n=1 Tax=Actinomadura barringtoniae TaxID=1427535 RepID=A0A939T8L5_9ACTN|nr:HAMP domain-containing sensor histidine kinase [Actinomadura barringtoniae]MBO2454268.1 HAMP domain-containing histidine kinase [Actinomadura barringtoniae]
MTVSGGTGRGALARLRAVPERTPLRVKLIAGMLVLVTLGLAVMGTAGVWVLRDYLVGRADNQLRMTAASIEGQIERQRDNPSGQAYFRVPADTYWEVRDANGRVTQTQGPTMLSHGQPKVPGNVTSRTGTPFTTPGKGGSSASWRVLAEQMPGDQTLVLALSMNEADRTVGQLVGIDLIVGVLVVAALAALGIWLVQASLRRLAEIESTASAIAAGDLSRRVPEADPRTEVGRLGRSLNTMLAQIEAAFGARAHSEAAARRSEENALRSEERMRRFVADASHELRTPLTAIRGFAEFYRQGAARSPEELDRLIGRIEDAASRMGLLVEDLLLLARLDRQRPIERRPVDLLAVAAEAVEETRVVAPDRCVDLSVKDGIAYQVLGDEARLRQVIGNLLANAVAYTPEGSPIEVRLMSATLHGTPAAAFEVADEGPGLTPEQKERVFERFYRADPSRGESGRGRSDSGTGLGLAIVAALVAAHEGIVEVESAPGEGAVFRVLLPLADD